MSYLKTLPVDELKVDRSFVQDMATDEGNRVLVESTVELGHNLGLAVVAEAVEDASTLAALARHAGQSTVVPYISPSGSQISSRRSPSGPGK